LYGLFYRAARQTTVGVTCIWILDLPSGLPHRTALPYRASAVERRRVAVLRGDADGQLTARFTLRTPHPTTLDGACMALPDVITLL